MRGLVLFAAALTLVRGCADTSTDCAYYKEAGYCESYGDTLKEMCAKTCGFCKGTGGGDGGDPGTAVDPRPAREPESMELCRDTCSSKDCAWYKSQGHCEKYSAVMVMNCASSCGWCGSRVCTPPDVENGWTDFEMIMVPSGATINVNCYEGFKNMGSAQLTCNGYGEIDGSARCEEIATEGGYPAAEETACQRAAKSAMESSYANGQYVVPQVSTHYVPQCDEYNGNYKEIQYDGGKGETFCVDAYRGIEVQGTRIQGKHEYIGCAPGSAKEYYDRLAQENQASSSSSGSSSYDYSYDSGSSYDAYNYDTSSSNTDYSYDTNSGYDTSGYDYSYSDSSGYDNSGYDNSGYDNSGYDNSGSGYDYNYGGDASSGADSSYDTTDYSSGDSDSYYAGGDDYYAGGDDYYASGDEYYAGGDDYSAGDSDYYATGDDGYSSDGYYAEGSGDYYAESTGDGYDVGDGYAVVDDGYSTDSDYYASGDGFDNSYYYAEGDEGAEEEADVSYRKVEAAVPQILNDDVQEEPAAMESGAGEAESDVMSKKDKDARRRMRKRRRNKRDVDADLADE